MFLMYIFSQKSKMVGIEFGKLNFVFEGDLKAHSRPPRNL